MRRATLLLVTLALGPLASASTQEPPEPGQRVKVRYSCTTISWKDCSSEGIVVRLDADTLVLMAAADSTMTFPVASVTRLELSLGQKSMAGRGAVIGLALGGVGGGVLVGAACANDPFTQHATVPCAAVGAVVFGAGGALIGGLIGAMSTGTRWEEVPLERLRVSFVPQRDGRLGLGLSVRF